MVRTRCALQWDALSVHHCEAASPAELLPLIVPALLIAAAYGTATQLHVGVPSSTRPLRSGLDLAPYPRSAADAGSVSQRSSVSYPPILPHRAWPRQLGVAGAVTSTEMQRCATPSGPL